MRPLPSTIAEAGALLRAGEMSSVELTDALLERVGASQQRLAAFTTITVEGALEAARRADDERARGIDRGPLHGIPVAIKDILATREAPTTVGSRAVDPAWGDRDDAAAVRRLKEGGAVVVGKLALYELAIGTPDPDTGFPPARNPWDPERTPGGSSSGTAVAVAAGLVLGGLGTDTGGSVRQPSAQCGITGLKPTFGRVSTEGCFPLAPSLDCIGPMARTARDCALMLDTIAGHDPSDPRSASVPIQDPKDAPGRGLAGLRIGIPNTYFFAAPELAQDVGAAVKGAVNRMAECGADIVEVTLPHAAEASAANTVILRSEAFALHRRGLRDHPELYGRYARDAILVGALFTAADYLAALRLKARLTTAWRKAFERIDAIVVPTLTRSAGALTQPPPAGLLAGPSFTNVWSFTGFPAVSVPCGFSDTGMPVGMQIVGAPFAESTILRIADEYQAVTDWHARRPSESATPVGS